MQEAVVYTRVSSREQNQEGFSLAAQMQTLEQYAVKNGFKIVRSFLDIETAKKQGRKQFNEMVTWLKRNRNCRILLVEKTDRLFRNYPDATTIDELNIYTHFVKENDVLSVESKSQTCLMSGIRLVMAKNYSENLREEVMKGMAVKAEGGTYPGKAPFGYKNNIAERKIDAHPEKSLAAIRIFELYASGKYSTQQIPSIILRDLVSA